LAIVLATVVVCFAVQAAGHWHSHSYEDQHCRICHFAHSASIDATPASSFAAPVAIERLTWVPVVQPALDVDSGSFSSRAPPA
jgi:hypothetical protein